MEIYQRTYWPTVGRRMPDLLDSVTKPLITNQSGADLCLQLSLQTIRLYIMTIQFHIVCTLKRTGKCLEIV